MLNRIFRELARHFSRGRGGSPQPPGGDPSYEALFREHDGRLVDKWVHYFEIYDRHLQSLRNRRVKVLEIGVYHGGSLQLLRRFLGPQAEIVGIDIDPRCVDYAEPGIRIEIGDQSSPEFWAAFFERYGSFDIIVDDGSHVNPHMITTFTSVWPFLSDGGILLFEDCHTSYLKAAGGGLRAKGSFIEFSKDRIDDLNGLWGRDPSAPATSRLTYELGSISYYDSVVVFEKRVRTGPPRRTVAGTPSRELTSIEQETIAAARAK
jgi:Methyltransferase domain